MNVFYQPLATKGINYLDEEESRHCVRVLRHQEGDTITIVDGVGGTYTAKISKADARACEFIVESTAINPPHAYSIHIAIAPTKNADRIEWFVEKSVEFGIDSITLMQSEHSERTFIKLERLRKVAISAMKQSLKASLPLLEGPTDFLQVVKTARHSQRFIAHVDSANPLHLKDAVKAGESAIILIGPEGDFSNAELTAASTNGFEKVSLGKSRLRTETAGIAACHILNLVNT